MKTDRELTELAARAAGIKVLRDPNGQLRNCQTADPCVNIFALPPWMPLTDDGDALRLAVLLMEFEPYKSRGFLPCISNDAEQTRRAIVRAAAAIGEAM